jgi:uncharacterized protein (DUF1800 family)
VDASRFLHQATFGPTEALLSEVQTKGVRQYLLDQFAEKPSVYTRGGTDEVHTTLNKDFCEGKFAAGTKERENCWRDWFSSDPLKWDFFQQAISGKDQLRQRTAWALQQILVISERDVSGTYGLREYFQMIRNNALGNYKDLLREVSLSPAMGFYLNNVNNEGIDPNENYARELLQLFSIGTCELNMDGSLKSGACIATYNNTIIRDYAYSLSGYTYPAGGKNPYCTFGPVPGECGGWENAEYYKGRMVAKADKHDNKERKLLSGVTVPASRTPAQALDAVINSLMQHPNIAPFIARQMIQHFVTSNPSPAYVQRVANAFSSGVYNGMEGGTGKGDLRATVAAVLMDGEARDAAKAGEPQFGKVREPVMYMTGLIRAMNGQNDGDSFGRYWHGESMGQSVFSPPSVFNYYALDYPLPGKPGLVAPQLGITNASTSLSRANFANDMIYWWFNKYQGVKFDTTVPGPAVNKLDFSAYESVADDLPALVARLNLLLVNNRLSVEEQNALIEAGKSWDATHTWLADDNSNYKRERVKMIAYILFSSPRYQVQR